MSKKPENRVDRIVSDLLRGRRLKLRGGDAEEVGAIIVAARLAAAGPAPQRIHRVFRQRLARALEAAPQDAGLTRRSALVAGLGVAAGVLGGVLLEKQLQPSHAAVAVGQTIHPTNGRWVDVGALADFADGQGARVTAGAVGAFLFRTGDTVSAVSSICSELPCELQWKSSQGVLNCPCHQRTFTVRGQSTDQVYPLPSLDVVSVRVTGAGRVEVLGT